MVDIEGTARRTIIQEVRPATRAIGDADNPLNIGDFL
jgi:hypothetical protein